MMSDRAAAPAGVTPLGANLPGGKFLTVAEVPRWCGCPRCRSTGSSTVASSEAVQFGRSFRVSEKALNAYLAKAYDAG